MSIQDRVASYLNIPPDSKQAVTITDEKLCEIGASVAALEREAAQKQERIKIADELYGVRVALDGGSLVNRLMDYEFRLRGKELDG